MAAIATPADRHRHLGAVERGTVDPVPTAPVSLEPRLPYREDGDGAARLYELVSPELVLVDPELRARLLSAGLDPRARAGAGSLRDDPPRPQPGPASTHVQAEAGKRRSWEAVAAPYGVLLAMLIANGVGALPDPGSSKPVVLQPAPTGQVAPAATQTPSVGLRPPAAGGSRGRVVQRRLVWAPVPGVSSYEVALYRGARRVFDARTPDAAIELGVGAAGPRTVAAGTYLWFVWPLRGGRRDGSAIVSSHLQLTS
jgi:hypothetical protein